MIPDPLDITLRQCLKDKRALDHLNLLLSAAEWPGASALVDVLEIVRSTGREEIPDAPGWPPR